MSCPTYDILNQLIDGELPADEMASVREHVLRCPECAGQVRAIQEIGNLVRGAALPVASDAILRRLSLGVKRIPDRAVRRVATLMTAAATIVLVVSALNVSRLNETNQTAQVTVVSPAEWEAVAISPEAPTTQEQVTARWIAADLSLQMKQSEETP